MYTGGCFDATGEKARNYPAKSERHLTNRTGSATVVGEVVVLDMGLTQAEVTTHDPSSPASSKNNVINAATADARQGFPAFIAQEVIADNATGKFLGHGVTKAQVLTTTALGRVAQGELLAIDEGNAGLLTVAGAGERVVAIAQEQGSVVNSGNSPLTETLEVWFFGDRVG